MHSISICLTDKCSASCQHCCMSCSPNCDNILDQEKIIEILNQIKNNDKITVINITGGEPFLLYDFLKKILYSISSMKKRATLVTNGFWANSQKIAEEKLLELANCGLKTLSVSLSHFHQEYINIDNIRNIISAARQLPIDINLKVAVTKDKMAFDLLSQLGDDIIDVPLCFFSVAPVGRAKNINKENFIQKYDSKKWMRCTDKELVIYNNGDCYPCCSPAIFDTCFKIGNVFETPLDELMHRVDCNLLLHYLRKKGVNWFKDILTNDFNYHFNKLYESPCVLCADIFKDYNTLELLTPYLKKDYEKNKL